MQKIEVKKQYSLKETERLFYEFLAGGAKTKLLESVLELNLPALFASYGSLSAKEVANSFGLDNHRTAKWLNLLCHIGLVIEILYESCVEKRYAASPLLTALFGTGGSESYFYQDSINFWRNIAYLNLVQVLKGIPLPEAVRWPPKTQEAMEHLSLWMRVTSESAAKTIEKMINLNTISKVLDVGGNDATLACTFAKKFSNLEITVFDVPFAINMARNNVNKNNLFSQVKLVEGDFRKDLFPASDFDLVYFSRVLADWAPDICKMLLEKAKKVLKTGGKLLICEPFVDDNEDLTINWEYRYLFYDDFGVGVYKYSKTYLEMLDELGYGEKIYIKPDESTIYGVIIAEKV
ncbi:MAG: methyltransferase domain-containing protein [Candidatus Melainabacteria bacterium]|nr:methyltransferase domain-containing protein [Candidatus Melainabacteria bacterium]